jgi:hypothetical protein
MRAEGIEIKERVEGKRSKKWKKRWIERRGG